MTAPILAAATFCITITAIHLASIVIAIVRFRRSAPREPRSEQDFPPVSLVRPLCGIDNYAADTLSSTFALDYPRCEILFCVASAKDPVVPLIEALMAEHAEASARLLVGDERVSLNPKLNNVVKGWRAASHDWIIIADSNVLMPHDYIELLFASWRADTGLVASPPIGCRPQNIWAELECAFLNTYQARWQYLADTLGFGFAQGKTMLWRRADLEGAGGIAALARELAEDAAATKVVRGAGLKVRLVDRPLAQPLGHRSAAEVWNRQLRWARLRRASFPAFFLPEVISGSVLPMIALICVAPAFGLPPALCVGSLAALWYGGEMLLAAAAGWHVSPLHPLYGFARDLLLPVLFVKALRGDDFVWRGNEMQVERMRPRRMMAQVRPRLQEVAAGSRRRLRSLRARVS
ncbi:MAG TPA: ceramide glucosyltransferase [Xanthobacteraceae bacterium]|nr:ceramide glucosyltransferase [Xanthobacteraceae bacterium]